MGSQWREARWGEICSRLEYPEDKTSCIVLNFLKTENQRSGAARKERVTVVADQVQNVSKHVRSAINNRVQLFVPNNGTISHASELHTTSGLKIRVVLWPQSTKTSVGPPDSEQYFNQLFNWYK